MIVPVVWENDRRLTLQEVEAEISAAIRQQLFPPGTAGDRVKRLLIRKDQQTLPRVRVALSAPMTPGVWPEVTRSMKASGWCVDPEGTVLSLTEGGGSIFDIVPLPPESIPAKSGHGPTL